LLQTHDTKCTYTLTHTLHGPPEREEKAAEKATPRKRRNIILKKNQSKILKIVNKYIMLHN